VFESCKALGYGMVGFGITRPLGLLDTIKGKKERNNQTKCDIRTTKIVTTI